MHRNHPDLFALLIVTILILAIVLSGAQAENMEYDTLPIWMAPFGILMVLFIPGYAIVSALLPTVGSEKTLLLALGVSISISILGGVVLNLTPWGLTPMTWAILLCNVSLFGLILAWRRRRALIRNFDMGIPSLQKENTVTFAWAGFILLGAVVIAYIASKQTETTFTQLWAIPTVTVDGAYEIQIGIRNEEKQFEEYNLYIDIDGYRLEEWPLIPLGPNDEWITTFRLSDIPERPIQISLYRVNDLNHAYRWLRISPKAFQR